MASHTTAYSPDLTTAQEPLKILVVDDNPESTFALTVVLESLGEQIVQAHSGREALRKLLEDDFAVILLDVRMPDMDGYETAELARQRERSRNTPIIFLTGQTRSDEQMFRGYHIGAVDYLVKPIVPEVLRSKVSVFVELARQRQIIRKHADAMEQKNRELERMLDENRRLNHELEQRVQERTAELYRTNEELRQFAYTASHDLQEPLRTVRSFTQLLARKYGSGDEEAEKLVRYIVEGVDRMTTLLRDILAYSRVTEAHLPTNRSADCEAVLQTVLFNLSALIREVGVLVTHEPLPTVQADSGQLVQVFQNLIGNAIKYRSERPLEIHIRAQEDGDHWLFSVADNGIGIPAEYREQIFGIFKRLHGSERPGTGMGLAICKKIIERHGGRIWVESTPGDGSTFYFSIPQ